MLQPLDVAINRSFQQHFGDRYDEFISEALADKNKQTKLGNVKTPTALEVSNWCTDWVKSTSEELLTKSFTLCGITHPNHFNIEDLHEPLRMCFENELDVNQWESQFGNFITTAEETGWKFAKKAHSSFAEMIYKFIETSEPADAWSKGFIQDILTIIEIDPMLSELLDEEEIDRIQQGILTESFIEFRAASTLLKSSIIIVEFDDTFNEVSRTGYGSFENEIEIGLHEGKLIEKLE